jgi:hypothetical protein
MGFLNVDIVKKDFCVVMAGHQGSKHWGYLIIFVKRGVSITLSLHNVLSTLIGE